MFLLKKTYQNTEQKEGCFCNLYIARNEEFQFIINCAQGNVKCHIQHEEVDLDES